MRNIDYIRKMKPKELALFLNSLEYGCVTCAYEKVCTFKTADNYDCATGIKKWLKQERK